MTLTIICDLLRFIYAIIRLEKVVKKQHMWSKTKTKKYISNAITQMERISKWLINILLIAPSEGDQQKGLQIPPLLMCPLMSFMLQ